MLRRVTLTGGHHQSELSVSLPSGTFLFRAGSESPTTFDATEKRLALWIAGRARVLGVTADQVPAAEVLAHVERTTPTAAKTLDLTPEQALDLANAGLIVEGTAATGASIERKAEAQAEAVALGLTSPEKRKRRRGAEE